MLKLGAWPQGDVVLRRGLSAWLQRRRVTSAAAYAGYREVLEELREGNNS